MVSIRDLLKRRPDREQGDAVPDFAHFVITRHHIGAYNERLLEYRQTLFEEITLPSMDAQTERNFTWIIGIDQDMPSKYRERLDHLVETRPYIRLVELELLADFGGTIIKWCQAEAARRGVSRVLSTRIDNDDALHKDLLQVIQEEVRTALGSGAPLPILAAPTTGYRWVPSEGVGHLSFHICPSTGSSLLEPVDDLVLVYRGSHQTLPKRTFEGGGYVKAIDGDTRWWLHATMDASLSKLRLRQERREDTVNNENLLDISDDLLHPFGIGSGARIRSMEEPVFVADYETLMDKIEEVEAEIKVLRKQLRKQRSKGESEDPEVLARYNQLHEERKKHSKSLIE